jgi:hypothetical protein
MQWIFGNKLDRPDRTHCRWKQEEGQYFGISVELVNDILSDKSGSHDLNVLYLTMELLKREDF